MASDEPFLTSRLASRWHSLTFASWVLVIVIATSPSMVFGRTFEFATSEVTTPEVAVSPDGETLVFTILGRLFRVPAEGGAAEQLTFGPYCDSMPSFSLDGKQLAFLSDRGDRTGNVFVMEISSRRITQITRQAYANLSIGPAWSTDGQVVYFVNGKSQLCRVGVNDRSISAFRQLHESVNLLFCLPDGRVGWTEADPERRAATRIEAADIDGNQTTLGTLAETLHSGVATADGSGLYYCNWLGKNRREVCYLRFADRDSRIVVPLTDTGLAPPLALAAKTGQLFLGQSGDLLKIDAHTGVRQAIPFTAKVRLNVPQPVPPPTPTVESATALGQPTAVLSPRLSPDGGYIVFMAAGFLWKQPLDNKTPAHRLFDGHGYETSPAFSPDGNRIAFVHTLLGTREIRVHDFGSGETRTVARAGLAKKGWSPGVRVVYDDLAWSPDGERLVVAEREYPAVQALVINLHDGQQERVLRNTQRPHFSNQGWLYGASASSGQLHRSRLVQRASPETVTDLSFSLVDGLASPDDKWCAFSRNRTAIWTAPLATLPIRDEDVRQFSSEGGYEFAFTPDSSSLIYAVRGRIWKRSLSGGQSREIPIQLAVDVPTAPPLLLRNVRVINLDAGEFGTETAMLIERGRIQWIGSTEDHQVSADALVIDARGRFAIPGLIDMHVHVAVGAGQEAFIRYGVTSVRDVHGKVTLLNALSDRSNFSNAPLPRYFFSGHQFHGDTFRDAEAARAFVHRLKASGASLLKVRPLALSYAHIVAEEARQAGLPLVAHVNSPKDIVRFVNLGCSSVEHTGRAVLYHDVLQMLTQAGTQWCPTLTRIPQEDPYAHRQYALATIPRARALGVRLLPGSDRQEFGLSLHWELEHLSQAGLSPLELIRIATRQSAEALGLEKDVGTLEAGKVADLILLDRNPLESARNLRTVWRTIKGGRVFNPDEILTSNAPR